MSELHIYLLDNQLKDIFSLFIENILEEISKCITENEALVETSNVVLKWKKLFDKINFQGLTIEKQKGLILFSATLIAKDLLMDSLEGKKPVPFFQSHGKQDPVLNFAESMKLFELLKLNRFQGEFIPFDGAHEIPQIVVTKVSEYINRLG